MRAGGSRPEGRYWREDATDSRGVAEKAARSITPKTPADHGRRPWNRGIHDS
ncbi:hypothetical protein CSB85_0105 [Pseudomonas aeruginosa]|nr:hypothetical protein CSB97_0277 [Pseudomonas aeruginosa]AVK23534.1 hypothetical protein CSB85_0105 [Pseudomonas aeruginosa]AWE77131.1 hypothetical protein CSC31_3651 [Pseudomonas aeruginosa]AWZ91811.1 hypothetical protein CSC46_5890 [Pseudomonas aeruginosa]CCQ88528.1 hypothetical protein PA18A_5150 [Pseudomonas aeruginosa 18A]